MAIKKSMSAAVAIEKLEAQCSMSEYCSSEVMDKLYRWGVPSADRAGILAHLVEARFVDDSRYARAYVRDKATFGKWGRRKILLGLMSKRIPRDVADEAMEEIDEERYFENLCSIVKAKLRSVKAETEYELKTKLYQRGLQSGYESELVARAVKQILKDHLSAE